MCGIAGYYSNCKELPKILNNIISDLNHRGPDIAGMRINNGVGLGHTRLSIIDLNKKSNQPFVSENGRYSLVYNGEIYNYKELRHLFEKRGHVFRTDSDPEVVLIGFIEFKEKIVKKLKGMFAFAIYDNIKKSFFLARDRFGIKPLFFYLKNETFWFCSEMMPLNKNISQE